MACQKRSRFDSFRFRMRGKMDYNEIVKKQKEKEMIGVYVFFGFMIVFLTSGLITQSGFLLFMAGGLSAGTLGLLLGQLI